MRMDALLPSHTHTIGTKKSARMLANAIEQEAPTRAHRQESGRHHVLVGLAQTGRQRGHNIAVELGMPAQYASEGSAADESELAVLDGVDAGRPRQAIDHRQFAHDRARPQDSKNALFGIVRGDADPEHAAPTPMTAVAAVTSLRRRLASAQLERPLACQQFP